MVIKCDPRAYAKCPDRERCGSLNEACFTAGSDCESFNEKVISAPQTNGDRIRAMTDEELAAAIAMDESRGCPFPHPCKMRTCKDCYLAWLQQPAEEVQNHG